MKKISFILLMLALISCGENKVNKHKAQSINSHKSQNAKKLYQAYIPSSLKLSNVLFVALDAHGDANLGISHFRWAAEQYGFRVIALNNVENNDPQYEQHIQEGIEQAKQDLDINPNKIFMAGFSGGARMALNYANLHQAHGVIMMGAGPGNQSSQFPFPLAMISGTRDFNFKEQYYPINSPQVQNPNIITLHWQGKHEWPDSSSIVDGVSFVLYASSTIQEADILRIPQLEKAKQAQKNHNIFLYFKELELISKTSTGEMHEKTKASISAIQQSTNASRYFRDFNNQLIEEQKRNQIYLNDLDEKPLDWWQNNLQELDDLSNNQKGIKADSYARTKAFLGILLYSKTSAAVAGRGNAKLLPKYLSVYEMIEPNNPDLFYFKAVYSYALSDNDACIANLKTAIKYGYKDDTKLHQSFPQMIISAAQKP